MTIRPTFVTVAAGAALAAALTAAAVAPAQAKTTELVDRSMFEGTPERTASTLHLSGATSGPLGGALDFTATAVDGTLPTVFGSCEDVDVSAVLTVSPGEVLTVATTGEACAHIVDGTLQINAFFGPEQVTYEGTAHKKAKLVGDGLIAAAHHTFGGQASFSGSFRW
ncbi:MAG: hypothetical protein ACRDO2_00810 [Nocardioidaceae bacterium]